MRAMAIAVKADTATGGFVQPGDRVDLILSYQARTDGPVGQYSANLAQSYASQTVLSNLKVLAVDQKSSDEDRSIKVPKTVTLEVTKRQAEILALSTSVGEISLALRRVGEQDVKRTGDGALDLTTDLDTLNTLKAASRLQQQSKTIRLYSGTTIQAVPVRSSQTERPPYRVDDTPSQVESSPLEDAELPLPMDLELPVPSPREVPQ